MLTLIKYSPPKENVLAQLTEAMRLGSIIALNTAGDDPKLRASLFKMVNIYERIVGDKKVLVVEIEEALKEFYLIDPGYVKLIRKAENVKTPKRNGKRRNRSQLQKVGTLDS